MNVDFCVQRDGEWWYHGRGCTHGATTDEAGVIMPVGWTAQQSTNPTNEEHHHE